MFFICRVSIISLIRPKECSGTYQKNKKDAVSAPDLYHDGKIVDISYIHYQKKIMLIYHVLHRILLQIELQI